jgi:putative DNA primase/helicase
LGNQARRDPDLRHGAGLPPWLAFLDGCFTDQAPDEKAAIIASLQEWFGAAMVSHKPRELRKALWLHGESRVGKTRVLEVLRMLIGEPSSSMKLKSLNTHFGPSALIGKRGWIADDVVGAGDEVDDAAFKCVVTGEAFSTDVKRDAYATMRLDIPVAFSSNALPRVKDQSDGVFNRSILIPMHVVRSEEETAGKAMIEDVVRAGELAGVFAWALEGWARLSKRGMFLPPASMREAADAFKAANNPVSTWVAACLVNDSFYMVDRRDLYASFCGWFRAEFGDTKPPTQKIVMTGLRQCAKLLPDHKSNGRRYMTGIKLTSEGLVFREDAPRSFGGETRGSGDLATEVNKPRRGADDAVP